MGVAEILHQKQLILQISPLKGDPHRLDDLPGEKIPPDEAVEYRHPQPVPQQRVDDSLPNARFIINSIGQHQLCGGSPSHIQVQVRTGS